MPRFLQTLPDGTVKQVNPFTGTQVWTVPGRGNRPLGLPHPDPRPLTDERRTRECAFCQDRYLDTPPEKARMVAGATFDWLPAARLFDTVADFRRVPNLFEILSYDYWRLNHGYEVAPRIARRRADYLADPAGRAHVLRVIDAKLRAAGEEPGELTEDERLARADGFFGGGHDVVIARRHFADDAADDSGLASSGTLSPDEHRAFVRFAADSARRLYAVNPHARYVAVFQNWLRPAGASFDHLHKQLVAIDELGASQEATLARLESEPDLFNAAGVDHAAAAGLIIATTEHAVAWAGFGHRYPTIEIASRSPRTRPWEHTRAELDSVSDLLHAMHAATGADVPCNEEWYYQPPGVATAMPWRVLLKWRVSTLAGFEGATRIYLNTVSPAALRERVVTRLAALQASGAVAACVRIGGDPGPAPLRYLG